MRQQRGLIFDLDGTLIDSALTMLAVINAMRQERGVHAIDMAELRLHISKGARDLVSQSLGGCSGDPDEDLAAFRLRYAALEQGVELLYPEVADTLEQLRRDGWVFGVCTNKPGALSHQALAQTGLSDFFPTVVAGDSGLPSKPHPAPLLACCREMGVDPADAIYVGDSEVDMETARNAGCRFVFVTYGYPIGDPEAVQCAARVTDFSSLPHALQGLGGFQPMKAAS